MTEVVADSNELDWLDQSIIDTLKPEVDEWLKQAAACFDVEPVIHTIHWFGSGSNLILAPEGVGGFAYAPGEMSLAWNEDFTGDRNDQKLFLKDTVYHELYHEVQGFVGIDNTLGPVGLIANAIFEGSATVFAREKVHAPTKFADEAGILPHITEIISELSLMEPEDTENYDSWKFNHPQYGRHVLYKLGVHMVDKALASRTDWKIEDLARMPWRDIADASGLLGQ